MLLPLNTPKNLLRNRKKMGRLDGYELEEAPQRSWRDSARSEKLTIQQG